MQEQRAKFVTQGFKTTMMTLSAHRVVSGRTRNVVTRGFAVMLLEYQHAPVNWGLRARLARAVTTDSKMLMVMVSVRHVLMPLSLHQNF